MDSQKGELNSPKIWSRIKSAFSGSRPKHERIWDEIDDLWNALVNISGKVKNLMVDFTRLDEAIKGAVADIEELKTLRPKVAALEAEVAALKADAEMLQGNVDFRAAKIEDARGGSTGGVV